LRGRLPTWVVRMRSRLVFMTVPCFWAWSFPETGPHPASSAEQAFSGSCS